MSVSQWSCVFTWASSRVSFSWTGDRGRLCRLHAASDRDAGLSACLFLWQWCQIGCSLWILWPSLLSKVYSQATSCQTRRIRKRRRGGRPSSPVSSRQQSGEGLWALLQWTWRKSPTVHAKQWLQSLTGCLCKTHSESSSQVYREWQNPKPTRRCGARSSSPQIVTKPWTQILSKTVRTPFGSFNFFVCVATFLKGGGGVDLPPKRKKIGAVHNNPLHSTGTDFSLAGFHSLTVTWKLCGRSSAALSQFTAPASQQIQSKFENGPERPYLSHNIRCMSPGANRRTDAEAQSLNWISHSIVPAEDKAVQTADLLARNVLYT